jgi:hypothetical protein
MLRFARNQTMGEPEVRKLIGDHGFTIANHHSGKPEAVDWQLRTNEGASGNVAGLRRPPSDGRIRTLGAWSRGQQIPHVRAGEGK